MAEFKDTYTADVSGYVAAINQMTEAEKKREELRQQELQDLEELKARRAEATNTKDITDYNKRIAESEKNLKVLSSATGDQTAKQKQLNKALEDSKKSSDAVKASFGNLKNTILANLPGAEITGFGQQLFALGTSAQGLTAGIKGSTAAMKGLKVAFAATGIGAVVIVLGSLIAYLTQTQAGLDKVRKFTAQVGTGFGIFTDILSEVGKVLFDFSDILLISYKPLTTFAKALFELASGNPGKAFDALKTGATEFVDTIKRVPAAINSINQAGKNISAIYANASKNIEESGKLTDRQIANERAIKQFLVEQSALREQIKAKNLIGENVENKNFQERIKVLKEAGDLERQIQATTVKLLTEKLAIQKEINGLTNSLETDTQAERDIQIELNNALTQSKEAETTQNAKINSVLSQIRAQETARGIEQESFNQLKAEELEGYEELFKAINRIGIETENRLKTTIPSIPAAYGTATKDILKLSEELGVQSSDLYKELIEGEFETFADFEKKKREEIKDTSKQQSDAQKAITEASINSAEVIADTAFQLQQQTNQRQLSLELSRIANTRDTLLRNEELTEAEKLAINESYEAQRLNLEKEAFERNKKLKRAEILIDAAVAAVSIIAKSPDPLKPLGPIVGAQLIALGISTGAQLALLDAQKFAKGTDSVKGGVKGRDSVLSLLMPEEAVITADKNKKYKGVAKAMNEGRFEDFVYKNWVMPTIERELSSLDIAKGKIMSDSLLQGLQMNATLKDGNILQSLHLTRKEQKRTNQLLARIANQSKQTSYMKWN